MRVDGTPGLRTDGAEKVRNGDEGAHLFNTWMVSLRSQIDELEGSYL
jgi:hypothetical protein